MNDDQKMSSGDQPTTSFVETAIRLGVLALLLYWSLVLVRPFISIVIWGAVLAVVLYPVFDWTARQLGGRRRLAAALITIVNLLIVVGPATWLALGLIEGLQVVAERLDLSTLTMPPPPKTIKDWPLIGEQAYQFWDLASTNFAAAFAKIAPQLKPLGTGLLRIGADTGIGIFKFLASIVIAGFLFSPGPSLVNGIRMFSRRLNPERGEEFVHLAGTTIRAVSRGVIGISVLQALLAGIGLSVAGIPHASLITFVALLFGIVQIGAAVVLIPVIIWAWISMEFTTAALFTAYMVPVNLIDNILKPLVMGRGLKTPTLVIFVGVVGGTLAYGITGLFLGPIVLAVIWELFSAWISENKTA